MIITKKEVLKMVRHFPRKIDVEELMYRLYLRENLEAAEKDVKAGRVIPHEKAVKEISKWYK